MRLDPWERRILMTALSAVGIVLLARLIPAD